MELTLKQALQNITIATTGVNGFRGTASEHYILKESLDLLDKHINSKKSKEEKK